MSRRFRGINAVFCDFSTHTYRRCLLNDNGKQYDPLAKAAPDTTFSIEDRTIDGMGIFIVKKSMDAVNYEYKDGKNI